jgi:hypothetical protein
MTRWSAITRTPPQLLRARLRLALHSCGGEDLNRLVHHERGRYSLLVLDAQDEQEVRTRLADDPWANGVLSVRSVRRWTIWLRGERST